MLENRKKRISADFFDLNHEGHEDTTARRSKTKNLRILVPSSLRGLLVGISSGKHLPSSVSGLSSRLHASRFSPNASRML